MIKKIIAIASVCLMASAANATSQGQGQLQGQLQGQAQGQILVNKPTITVNPHIHTTIKPVITAKPVANGGKGGKGGKGGNATGGDAKAKSNSNSNAKAKSYSEGGKSKSYSEGGDAKAKSNQKQDASSENTIVYEAQEIPVSSAFAPAIVATSDCLGSIGGGVQGQFAGLTFGRSTQSKPCNIREFYKLFEARRQPKIAFAVLCQDKIVRKAVADAGKKCPKKKERISMSFTTTHAKPSCEYPTAACKKRKKMGL